MPDSLPGRLRRGAAAVYLITIEPGWRAWLLDTSLPRLVQHGWPALTVAVAHVAVAAAAIAAGRAILFGESRATFLGRAWTGGAVGLAVVSWLTPYFPTTGAPSERRLWLGITIAWYLAWVVILPRNPRRDGAETPGGGVE